MRLSAPACSSASTTASWPYAAAWCSAVRPSCEAHAVSRQLRCAAHNLAQATHVVELVQAHAAAQKHTQRVHLARRRCHVQRRFLELTADRSCQPRRPHAAALAAGHARHPRRRRWRRAAAACAARRTGRRCAHSGGERGHREAKRLRQGLVPACGPPAWRRAAGAGSQRSRAPSWPRCAAPCCPPGAGARRSQLTCRSSLRAVEKQAIATSAERAQRRRALASGGFPVRGRAPRLPPTPARRPSAAPPRPLRRPPQRREAASPQPTPSGRAVNAAHRALSRAPSRTPCEQTR